jgi:hypothetical protein
VTTGELAAVLALALLLGVAFTSPAASAADLTAVNISEELANLTAMANLTNTSIAIVTGIEDIVKPEPHYNPNMTVPYIYQGDTVYLDTTIDISGSIPPYPQLAYWDGFDMYNSVPSYNITLPDNKKGYYHFYVDPEIFRERTGNGNILTISMSILKSSGSVLAGGSNMMARMRSRETTVRSKYHHTITRTPRCGSRMAPL